MSLMWQAIGALGLLVIFLAFALLVLAGVLVFADFVLLPLIKRYDEWREGAA